MKSMHTPPRDPSSISQEAQANPPIAEDPSIHTADPTWQPGTNSPCGTTATLSDDPATISWYLIHTKPRQETVALTNLTRQGYVCYMPQIKLEKIRRRKIEIVEEPMFSRYLFIQLDTSDSGQSWSPIRSTLGVSGLVRFGGQPAKVSDQLINLLQSQEQTHQPEAIFTVGEHVTIVDGPFAGIEAIYQTTDAESRSIILLNILNKSVPMRIDTVSLRKAS